MYITVLPAGRARIRDDAAVVKEPGRARVRRASECRNERRLR
jgi:hypothetical protein